MERLRRLLQDRAWTADGWVARISVGLVAALGGAFLLGTLSRLHPLLEAITNVRAQLVIVAILPVACFVTLRRWGWAAVATVVFAISASYMVPYWTASADPLLARTESIRVMQYNIFFGNEDAAAMADHIIAADADVVGLHEPTPSQWDALAPLLAAYPYSIAEPLSAEQGQLGGGMVLLSRTPLARVTLDEAISPSDREILVGTTELRGQQVTVVGLHPFASRTESRKHQLRKAQLEGVADLVTDMGGPAVILTDMNIAPTSHLYQDFLSDMGWRDPHRVVGWQSTWPTWGGSFGMPIDHVFVSNHFVLHSYELGSGAGSDHKSLVAEISLRPS